ncbi:MAG: class I SAM-dependent methyltransferase [Phycisphaerales bacterium]|nr:class I SAM-dependent methyltransferase [Phycisphaerales bacterium]
MSLAPAATRPSGVSIRSDEPSAVRNWITTIPPHPCGHRTDPAAIPAESDWAASAVVDRYRRERQSPEGDSLFQDRITRDGLTLLRRIPLPRANLLDVGCGAARWAGVLADAAPPLCHWQYEGLELTGDLATLCRQAHPGLVFHVGAAESLPFNDAAFDVVLCSGVLSYVADWPRALREVVRVARRYVALLRTPVVKYAPHTPAWQFVDGPTGSECHKLTLFSRDQLRAALNAAARRIAVEDYSDVAHPVEGLDERLFFLDYLLECG